MVALSGIPASRELFAHTKDLQGQFAGGDEDESACAEGCGMPSAETLDKGDHVSQSLAGPCACHAD